MGLFWDTLAIGGSDSAPRIIKDSPESSSFGKARGSTPMGQVDSFANSGPDLAESLNIGQQEVLERAVGKMVLLGKQVGVSPDQMILLLESGLTVVDLLEYLAVRNGHRS